MIPFIGIDTEGVIWYNGEVGRVMRFGPVDPVVLGIPGGTDLTTEGLMMSGRRRKEKPKPASETKPLAYLDQVSEEGRRLLEMWDRGVFTFEELLAMLSAEDKSWLRLGVEYKAALEQQELRDHQDKLIDWMRRKTPEVFRRYEERHGEPFADR